MPRQELHSSTMTIEQKPPVLDEPSQFEGDIVTGENILGATDYLDQLAFMAEPVTIRLEPSSEKNAPTAFPVWVNGKAAEVFQRGRWEEIGYLPVGQPLTVRRSVLEVIIRAKTDQITTKHIEQGDQVNNIITRFTSPVHSFSILEDKNPKGPAWVAEIRRRNL